MRGMQRGLCNHHSSSGERSEISAMDRRVSKLSTSKSKRGQSTQLARMTMLALLCCLSACGLPAYVQPETREPAPTRIFEACRSEASDLNRALPPVGVDRNTTDQAAQAGNLIGNGLQKQQQFKEFHKACMIRNGYVQES